MTDRGSHWPLGVSLVLNALLVVLLVAKLDVSPAMLQDHVDRLEAKRDMQLAEITVSQAEIVAAQEAMLVELDARDGWMSTINDWRKELESRTDDRFRLHEFNNWASAQGLPKIETDKSFNR